MSEWTEEQQQRWLELEGRVRSPKHINVAEVAELRLLREKIADDHYRQLTSGEAEPEKRVYTQHEIAEAFTEGGRIGGKCQKEVQGAYNDFMEKLRGEA